MGHKSGFVNIIGNPNVGKSTLMNKLVGERLSIITSKAQTTRHRIIGIVNEKDYQIVFSDTPGLIKPSYKLQESMLKFSTSAFTDADVIVYVTDVNETHNKHKQYLERLQKSETPVILVINKIDLSNQEKVEQLFEKWQKLLPNAEIFPISALSNFNVDNLSQRIRELIPEFPPYFDKEELTDRPLRFFVSEIIREKILNYYKKEIPYAVEIVVDAFKESEDLIRISSTLYVERDSQKGIIIGHQGKALKKVGIEARRDLEKFLEKKVFLEIFVKVDKDWRNKTNKLKNFGYE